jgi:hypothetical protein
MELPKLLPEIFLEWMQRRVAGYDGAVEGPFVRMLRQPAAHRIFEVVMARGREGAAAALRRLEHMVVRLRLKPLRGQLRFQMRAQEAHAVELVGVQTQAHPDQAQVIRHEAIDRAEQSLAGGGVDHEFPEGRIA